MRARRLLAGLIAAVSLLLGACGAEEVAPPVGQVTEITEVRVVETSAACAASIAPIRALVASLDGPPTPEQRVELQRLGEESYDHCDAVEFRRFRDEELLPALRALS